MKNLIVLFVSFVFTPFLALLSAAAARCVWAWFLAPEYGPGPSTRAWFGISVLLGMALAGIHVTIIEHTEKKQITVTGVIVRALVIQFAIWVSVVCAFCAALVFGWR